MRPKSSAGSEIEERTRLGSTPTTSARLPRGTFFFPVAGAGRNRAGCGPLARCVRQCPRKGRYPLFQGWNTGSIPVGDANKFRWLTHMLAFVSPFMGQI